MNKYTTELAVLQSSWESIPDDEIEISEAEIGKHNATIKSCTLIKSNKNGKLFLKWLLKIGEKYIVKMASLNDKQIFYTRRDIERILDQKLEHATDIELVIDKMVGVKISIEVIQDGKYKNINIIKVGWDEFENLEDDINSAFNS